GQARVVRERTGERGALGSTLNGLGNTAVQLGRADTALICYRAAIELTVAAGDSARTGEALANLASTLVDLGERVAAAPYLERALRIARARGDARVESSLQRS